MRPLNKDLFPESETMTTTMMMMIPTKLAHTYGRENVGNVASLYMMTYVYWRRFLHTQYGIHKDGEPFMIGNSPVVIDTDGNITIKGTVFRGTDGLWELLKRKNVNTELIYNDDLK